MIGIFLAKKGIADAYEAINQHDMRKWLSHLTDDVTLIYPGEVPQSGTYRGKGEVEGFMRSFSTNSRDFNSMFKTFVSRTSLILPEPM